MKSPEKKDYVVTCEFWDGPVLRQVGDPLTLSDAQAKYMTDRVQEQSVQKPRMRRDPPVVAPE